MRRAVTARLVTHIRGFSHSSIYLTVSLIPCLQPAIPIAIQAKHHLRAQVMDVFATTLRTHFYFLLRFIRLSRLENVQIIHLEHPGIPVPHRTANQLRTIILKTFYRFPKEGQPPVADRTRVRSQFLQDDHIRIFCLDGNRQRKVLREL